MICERNFDKSPYEHTTKQAHQPSTGDPSVANKKKNGGVNRSEEIRQVFKANPAMKAKEVVTTLAAKGIAVTESLVYLVKGAMHGQKARKMKAEKRVAKVAETTGTVDALATIIKIKQLAGEVGGLKKLKALVEALSE